MDATSWAQRMKQFVFVRRSFYFSCRCEGARIYMKISINCVVNNRRVEVLCSSVRILYFKFNSHRHVCHLGRRRERHGHCGRHRMSSDGPWLGQRSRGGSFDVSLKLVDVFLRCSSLRSFCAYFESPLVALAK